MNTETIKEIKKEEKTISIRLPKIKLPTLQTTVLILLIAVGVLQTIQLFTLDTRITSAKIGSSGNGVSASSSLEPEGSFTSSLPNMVGGC